MYLQLLPLPCLYNHLYSAATAAFASTVQSFRKHSLNINKTMYDQSIFS